MTAAPSVSVVVPVYNGRDSIRELASRVDATLTADVDWELIFVVDGSPDDSWQIVRELAAQYPQIRGLELSRNFGQHSALLAGIRSARHDIIVTMDDDLQHRPETIPVLLEAMDDDIDLVYGVSPRREHSFWRNVTSRLAKTVMGWTIGGRMLRDSGAFRAFRTPLRTGFEHVSDSYISIDVLLSWVTVRYRSVVTPMDQRESGASNYTVRTLLKHALNMVTGYSSRPLRLVAWLGFGFALFGSGALVFVLVRYFTSATEVPGFAFLASLISILAGAQLFGLGVIGEYLGRMHFRSMHRPVYVIREEIDDNTEHSGT
jgi:undecaprenyl-phosphate 4-deoxy-4-formamido-L-arabinose transferase